MTGRAANGDRRRGPQYARRGPKAKLPPPTGWVLEPGEVEKVPLLPRPPKPEELAWRPHLDAILLLRPGQAYEIEVVPTFRDHPTDPHKLAERVRALLGRYGVLAALPYKIKVLPTARMTVLVKCLGV